MRSTLLLGVTVGMLLGAAAMLVCSTPLPPRRSAGMSREAEGEEPELNGEALEATADSATTSPVH